MSRNAVPDSLARNPRLDRWVRFNADKTVTIRTGKVELGQGILSTLAQLAAEELGVDYERIRVAQADTGISPNEGVTAGSKSVEDGGSAMTAACAEVRNIFLLAAATRLESDADALFIEDGTIYKTGSNVTTSYWELATEVSLARDAEGGFGPKPGESLKVVGRSLPRIDVPDKFLGSPFVHDMDFPGMLFGRVLRPPSYRARLMSLDTARVVAMPGVEAVVREGRFIGVVAVREEQAIAAVAALAKDSRWEEDSDLPDVNELPAFLAEQPAKTRILNDTVSDRPGGGEILAASYSRPFLSHGSIGPSCAVAIWGEEAIDVWTHSQSIHPLRKDIARVLDLDIERVVVHHREGAGCYGHNGADDAAFDAVLLARAVPGRHVKLQWSREDEMGWEPFGPAMMVRLEAGIDDAGNVTRWQHEVWSNAHVMRPGTQASPTLLAAWHLDRGFVQPQAVDFGASERNAIPLYTFPNQRIVQHLTEDPPVRTSTLRAIGAFANAFALESFVDELAHRVSADPVEFRLRHLDDERARAVIAAVAERLGTKAGGAGSDDRGFGIGFARYNNLGCYAAVAVEVQVADDIRVIQAIAAVDCGRVITPDGVMNQIEGGVVQAASWALKEQVQFDRTRITSRNWDQYPIIRFSEVPSVETILIDRPDQPSLGVGEGVAGPTAAAIANAVFNVTGIRIRDLPITRERMITAIEQNDG